jgi:FdhD protein
MALQNSLHTELMVQEISAASLHLTQARAPVAHEVEVVNELGETYTVAIPSERALTVYVDKQELVTLMTLGAQPELLVLGFLLNQRLIRSAQDLVSITVDWEVGAAAVKTHTGIDNLREKTSKRVVTTGCGQGSVFGDLMQDVDSIRLPETRLTQEELYAVVNTMRIQDSTYKSTGSVHGCALFQGPELLYFVEDVGRHNALDTIAGWMALQDSMGGQDKIFYTTGRLTSEMVIKAAQMGVAVVVSRSGTTQMGQALAQHLGLCTIGRALNRRFMCFSGSHRLVLQPGLAQERLRAVA